jgi:hypothetical protein
MYLARAHRTSRRHVQGVPLHTVKSSSPKVLGLEQINYHFRTISFREWKQRHIPVIAEATCLPALPLEPPSSNISANPTAFSNISEVPNVDSQNFSVTRSEEQCAICLESLHDEDWVREIPCLHCYHHKCIDMWLTTRRGQCPICKRDYSAELGGDELDRSETQEMNSTIAIREPVVTRETMPEFLPIPRIQDDYNSPSVPGLWKYSIRRDSRT